MVVQFYYGYLKKQNYFDLIIKIFSKILRDVKMEIDIPEIMINKITKMYYVS